MNTLYRLTDRFMALACAVAGYLAGGVIVFITAVVAAEVLLRLAGLPAFGWTLELCEYGLVVVAFLGSPWVLRHQDHISVDIVIRQVRPAVARVLLTLADAISALACVILARFAWLAMSEALHKGALLYKYFATPQWIVLIVLPIGAAMLAIEFGLRIWRRLGGFAPVGKGDAL